MLLHWLCSLMICLAFALCLIVPDLLSKLVSRAEGSMGAVGSRIAGAVLLALYIALSIAQLFIIIGRRKRTERGFISVGSDDTGRVRIAVSAVEQMVRQSVRTIDGITEMKVDIEGLDDAIAIGINATIAAGVHVPTITANMRRSITQFVEVNCGVTVQSVAITINAVNARSEPSRRRRLGFGRSQNGVPEPSFPQDGDGGAAAPAAPEPARVETDGGAKSEGIWTGASAASEPVPEAKATGFDPDKPYESEFAKDYAAMKARESAGASDASKE